MGVLTKYDQIEPIYLSQSVATYISLHTLYASQGEGILRFHSLDNNKCTRLTPIETEYASKS
jgi:hypothetical protein